MYPLYLTPNTIYGHDKKSVTHHFQVLFVNFWCDKVDG